MIAPYGSWKSPVTTDLIVGESISLGQIALDGDDVYWIEGRPREGGRNVVVKNGIDVTPAPLNARTRVHEYGGGAFLVDRSAVYFSNDADQRLYRQGIGETPQALTRGGNLRYADGVMDHPHNRIICVCEDHTSAGREAVNTLLTVALADRSGKILMAGSDFYASPRLNPDGSRLAWLTWNHPNMPWDGTALWVAAFDPRGGIANAQCIAGGENESIFQPEWSPDGILHFVSDRTGWWNLYRWRDGRIEHVFNMEAEFGMPQWVFGMSTYAFMDADRIACAYNVKGSWHLALLDLARGHLQPIPSPYTTISQVRANAKRIVFLGASPTEPESVVSFDLASRKFEVLHSSTSVAIDPGYVSVPEAIEFTTENGLTAHAFHYAPRNRDFAAPAGEKPPLVVMIHGGPTSATSSAFSLQKQFWTSRGFAVVDVNYGGSTGYGRAYRERLNGQWGIVDVDDCVSAARHLAAHGLADNTRLAIRGGSAGGFTTLAALTFRNVFRAGASYFGISDLAASNDTHKFESRYNYRLVAPWPQGRDVYRQRSPLFALDRLSCPIIFFQGLEDKIVLPNQSEMMVEAMKKKGLPVAYLAFEGEQHGFRKAETIKRTLEAELYFYSRVFGFSLADAVEPVAIDNL